MKKRMLILLYVGLLSICLCSCKSDEKNDIESDYINIDLQSEENLTEKDDVESNENLSTEDDTEQEEVLSTEDNVESEDLTTEESNVSGKIENEYFDFSKFENFQFVFSSGAGGWATVMTIAADGSFAGEFHDSEMGLTGDDYPNGTLYQCKFTGKFSQAIKINDYTYSMQIEDLVYEEMEGTNEIIDGVLYEYSYAYGLDEAENMLIYLPGTPSSELPDEFKSWVSYFIVDDELTCYGLYNETPQYGFSGYEMQQ